MPRSLSVLAAGSALCAALIASALPARAAEPSCPPLLSRTFGNIQTGKPQSLCGFAGKVVLFVNTASKCGYTPQYEGLEKLYSRYRDRGLVVAGFPSNDFGGQEPGTNRQIEEFCRTEFGIDFPMFEKSSVSGRSANPLFAELTQRSGQAPRWNFHKYVVDRSGARVVSFASDVTPENPAFVKVIEQFLADGPR